MCAHVIYVEDIRVYVYFWWSIVAHFNDPFVPFFFFFFKRVFVAFFTSFASRRYQRVILHERTYIEEKKYIYIGERVSI